MESTTAQKSGAGTSAGLENEGSEVAAQAREKTQELKSQATDKLKEQVDQRSTQIGDEAEGFASAVRTTAEQLRIKGKTGQAEMVDQAADRVDRVGGYLRDSSADRIFSDVEGFAQRRPWLVGASAAVVGFLASRLLKASSGRRFDSRAQYDGQGGR
jgi:ElaB/YqjD/DUF883 family membrane-anchored ribosome-binding protein